MSHFGTIQENVVNTVHIEVEVKKGCELNDQDLVSKVRDWCMGRVHVFQNGIIEVQGPLIPHINRIQVVDLPTGASISFWAAQLCIHAYQLSSSLPKLDFIEQEGEGDLPAYEEWELPNAAFVGLWDSIVVPENIKSSLLGYCTTSVRFSDANVDDNIISWNRMLILTGPPGTGKTTLCKALAQKVFIYNNTRYEEGALLDINAHSLFSKWFSESGKLVQSLFNRIHDIAEDLSTLVIVLIDEVESIAGSRTAALASGDPGDAVRVVNSVLNCLDALRRRPNVLVLCTSNMTGSIDAAFRDRIDISVFMGNPTLQARYQILASCVIELIKKGLVMGDQGTNWALPPTLSDSVAKDMEIYMINDGESSDEREMTPEFALALVSMKCGNFSGRRLRKLPLIAHAYHINRPSVEIMTFMFALRATVEDMAKAEEEASNVIVKV